MRTATTLEQVAFRQLRRLAKEMHEHNGMPSADLRTYPTNIDTTDILKNHIFKSVDNAHNQCNRWADELRRVVAALEGTL